MSLSTLQPCPCCSGISYTACCAAFHQQKSYPLTPEALMRSRYAAYALHLIDYLLETTHPSQRHLYNRTDIAAWATQNTWLRLVICEARDSIVEFKAHYQNKLQLHIHHERSTFKKEGGKWYYLKGSYFN